MCIRDSFIVTSLGIPRRSIKDVKTDCLVLKGCVTKRAELLQEVSELSFSDLPGLRSRFDKKRTFLDAYCAMSTRKGDDDKVYRFSSKGVTRLKGRYSEPFRGAAAPEPLRPWKDVGVYFPGEGLLLLGPPGVGKTRYLQTLVEKMRADGLRVDCVSKTNLACANLGVGCVTADHYSLSLIHISEPTRPY